MADDKSYLTDEYVSRLQSLTEALESRDEEKINDLVSELTTIRESSLYRDLGMLTREIHESINAFGSDQRIAELAQEELPTAQERLAYIVTKTDEAAHRTMNTAEETIEMSEAFNSRASEIRDRWIRFRNRDLSKEEFVKLYDDMDHYLEDIGTDTRDMQGKMTEIMLAQDYQDITGQMIKQVVSMVQEVEEKLVRLVAISGGVQAADNTEKDEKKSSGEVPEGPQLHRSEDADVATSQNEVDDLLSSLGF